MGKKEGSTSACYLWRFTEVWEMLMWLTFIYNMFRNGPHVHVLPLRLSYCTCSRKKRENCGVIQNLLCSARAHNDDFFFFFWKFSVTLVEDFYPPSPEKIPSPLSLNISLYVCLSPDEGAASRAVLLSYRSVSLKKCELFHGLAEQRFI